MILDNTLLNDIVANEFLIEPDYKNYLVGTLPIIKMEEEDFEPVRYSATTHGDVISDIEEVQPKTLPYTNIRYAVPMLDASESSYAKASKELVKGLQGQLGRVFVACLTETPLVSDKNLRHDIEYTPDKGTPADLKIQCGLDKVVKNIRTICTDTGPDSYGERYNLMVISQWLLGHIVGNAYGRLRELFDKEQNITLDKALTILSDFLGLEIHINDSRVFLLNLSDDLNYERRVLPEDTILLLDKNDFGKTGFPYRFGNGMVTESLVCGNGSYGPTAYFTGSGDGKIYANIAMRGKPYKFRETAAASIKVTDLFD